MHSTGNKIIIIQLLGILNYCKIKNWYVTPNISGNNKSYYAIMLWLIWQLGFNILVSEGIISSKNARVRHRLEHDEQIKEDGWWSS